MRRLWTLLTLASLGLGTAFAQPPGGDRPRPSPVSPGGPPNRERTREEPRRDQPREERRDQPRGEDRGGREHVERWMHMLAEHMIDPHDTVRDSARAGLVAMGEKALPMLRNLANGPDDARATAAKKVIEAIERGHRRPGPGGPGARTGGGFGGPMGRGGPPLASGGPAPFNRGPMTGGFPGGPMGFGRGEPMPRPDGRPIERRREGDYRRPDAPRPEGGERRPEAPRPEGRPMERRPEGGERREGERRPEGRPEGRPMERRPDAPRPEGGERREGERREGERRPEAPRPTERRPG